MKSPDFEILSSGKISNEFLQRGLISFREAAEYISRLPYGRNSNRSNTTTIFLDNCGTCSTKHALLKKLADEQAFEGINLVLGIFRMNRVNTPKISATLNKYDLEFIPEAHCYLRFHDLVIDYTSNDSERISFIDNLLEETIIQPHQITDFKFNYHNTYLEYWLKTNNNSRYTLDEIWAIREECIGELSVKNNDDYFPCSSVFSSNRVLS